MIDKDRAHVMSLITMRDSELNPNLTLKKKRELKVNFINIFCESIFFDSEKPSSTKIM